MRASSVGSSAPVASSSACAREGEAAFGLRGEHEALGEQREQPGVGRGVGRVGDRDRGLDDVEVGGRVAVDPHEAPVGGEGRPDDAVVRAAAAGQVGAELEGLERPWIAGAVLRVAEPHEQVGALGVGAVERCRHLERDAVVLRGLDGCELVEGVVAGARRPALRIAASPASAVCRASWTTTSGGTCSKRFSSARAARSCRRARREPPSSAYSAWATRLCTNRIDRRTEPVSNSRPAAVAASTASPTIGSGSSTMSTSTSSWNSVPSTDGAGQHARHIAAERVDPAPRRGRGGSAAESVGAPASLQWRMSCDA